MRTARLDLCGFLISSALVVAGCKANHAADGAGGTPATSDAGTGVGGAGTPAGAGGSGSGSGGVTGGAGSTGAGGSSGGSSGNACATAIFCDDFEAYAAGAAPGTPWRTQANGGTVSVDTSHSRSGGKSVKLTTQARTTNTVKTAFIALTGAAYLPAPGNVFYGRVMFFLEAAPATSVHWTLIQGSGVVPGRGYHALYRYGGQLPIMQGTTFVGSQLMANYDTPDSYAGTPPASDCWRHANKVVVPVGVWTCVEWKFDGPNNGMSFWMTGAPVPSLTVNGAGDGCVNQPATPPYTWTAPTFDRIDLGWESYQIDDARTIYLDDVVISRSPIGCPP